MTYRYIILIGMFLSSATMYGCASMAPDTGVTGRTIDCGGETRMLMNCKRTFKQYARNMRVDIAKIKKHAYGAGIGAEKLMRLDTVSGDLMAQQRQLCVDYNNCILSKKEYKVEAAFLRRAQAKIRQAAAQMSSGPAGGGPFDDGGGGGGGGSSQPPQAPAAFNQLMSGIVSGLGSSSDEGGSSGGYDDPAGGGMYEDGMGGGDMGGDDMGGGDMGGDDMGGGDMGSDDMGGEYMDGDDMGGEEEFIEEE